MKFLRLVVTLFLVGMFAAFLITLAREVGTSRASPESASAPSPTKIPDAIMRARQMSIIIVKLNRSAGGVFAHADLDIENRGPGSLKDPRVVCEFSGKSGTVLSRPSVTIYEQFPPGKTRRLKNVRLGTIPEQAHTANCEIVSADI